MNINPPLEITQAPPSWLFYVALSELYFSKRLGKTFPARSALYKSIREKGKPWCRLNILSRQKIQHHTVAGWCLLNLILHVFFQMVDVPAS